MSSGSIEKGSFNLFTDLALDDDEMDALVDDYNNFAQKYAKISQESKLKNGKRSKLRIINVISSPGEFE